MIKEKTARALALVLGAVPMTGMSASPAWAEDPAGDQAPSQTTATYGDWTMRCRVHRAAPQSGDQESEVPAPAAESRLCELTQATRVAPDNGAPRRLTEVAIGRLPGADEVTVLVRTPLDTLLREGVTISGEVERDTEAGTPMPEVSLSYLTCDAQGCLADTTVPGKTIDALATATAARLVFVDRGGRRIAVPLSLNGLRVAFHALASS